MQIPQFHSIQQMHIPQFHFIQHMQRDSTIPYPFARHVWEFRPLHSNFTSMELEFMDNRNENSISITSNWSWNEVESVLIS
jgi:hypothetical protein